MVWRYTYGKDYEFLLKMEVDHINDTTWKTPVGVSSLPDIDPIFDQPYITAFYMLDSSRPMGMGLGAIPLSEITNLWDRIQLGEEEEFMEIIQGADMAYLKAYHDDQQNKPS